NFIRAGEQPVWTDPESGYQRRILSPPSSGLRGELVEVRLPPRTSVSFDQAPITGLEHHLWMLEGFLALEVEGSLYRLGPADSLRYGLAGRARFQCIGKREARYVIAIVHR